MTTDSTGTSDAGSSEGGALLYSAGQWTRIASPLSDDAGYWRTQAQEAGYSEFFKTGDPDLNYLAIRVSKGPENYLIELDSSLMADAVFAATLPDAMELLAKWVPVVNAVTLGNLLVELDGHDPGLSELLLAALRRRE
ncbi:hypothetical protein [Streptacidiphilus carbonis]|uniref:hypothetical protein n=1 Tax=Streptacidiphilus carbonis TaxID=105422 RepID=UPI0005A7DFA1|nr:hypothetical protein [Streptacidiphilus carbonis]